MFDIIKPFAFKMVIMRLLHLPMIQSDERWSGMLNNIADIPGAF